MAAQALLRGLVVRKYCLRPRRRACTAIWPLGCLIQMPLVLRTSLLRYQHPYGRVGKRRVLPLPPYV